ncbi:MAG: indolepyruvate ferredoxin oxidoreductase subunit alpha [Desulfurococcaceae archaeon]
MSTRVRSLHSPLLAPPGTRLALMGNEAIARGAIESGMYVVTGYPGTPSSEVIMSLQEVAKELGIYVEWAVNERVALEIAIGAAIAGARAMATMKAPGLNVASDPLLSAAYSGVDGALVVYVADDPGPHTTQTEQDSRWYAKLSKLPMVSPSSPQEAKDFVKASAELSERLGLPVLLRTTTRVSHAVGEVVLGEAVPPRKARGFSKDPQRFVRAGMSWNLERHKWLNARLAVAEQAAEGLGLNSAEGDGDLCVIAEGVAYGYAREAAEELGLLPGGARLVKLGLIHPLPRRFLRKSLDGCKRILVVEELDPFLEEGIRAFLHEEGIQIPVYGKSTGHLPLEGELSRPLVIAALASASGRELKAASPTQVAVHARPPPLCPGCPHRNSFLALRAAISRAGYRLSEVPIIGDIGCYALAVYPPINMLWTEHSMGASISMAMGLKVAGYEKPVVAVIGDSTFFHAGIQPLLEAVHKRVDLLVLVLDNGIVAMTGHQSTPAWAVTETGREARPISIERVIESLGVDALEVVDPYDLERATQVPERMLRAKGVRVVVMRHPCALEERRAKGVELVYRVDEAACDGCRACLVATGCPAIYIEGGKAHIVEEDCNGCGLCARYCPRKAIYAVKVA